MEKEDYEKDHERIHTRFLRIIDVQGVYGQNQRRPEADFGGEIFPAQIVNKEDRGHTEAHREPPRRYFIISGYLHPEIKQEKIKRRGVTLPQILKIPCRPFLGCKGGVGLIQPQFILAQFVGAKAKCGGEDKAEKENFPA